MPTLRKGFAAEAEAISEEVRAELGIGNISPLNPLVLAAHLDALVWSLAQLKAVRSFDFDLAEAIDVLHEDEQSSLSAFTVFAGSQRLIVYNEHHSIERRASDLCHELAHVLLIHEPAPVLDDIGCRAWDSIMEREAEYLGGALLIPGKGARWAGKCKLTDERTAARFLCSVEMGTYRLNVSGARRLK